MDYFATTRTLEDKLAATLDNNGLLHTMDRGKYPITMTITQNKAPDAQMEIFAESDGSVSAQDSVLRFIFKLDALEIQTNSRFVISDSLMNKIKNQAKKIHAAYVHAFFAAYAGVYIKDLPAPAEAETPAEGEFDGFYTAEEYSEDYPDDEE